MLADKWDILPRSAAVELVGQDPIMPKMQGIPTHLELHVKVLILNASHRKRGTTSALLSEFVAAIDSKHDVEVVRLNDIEMKPCTGCLRCRSDGQCVLPRDGAHALADAIRRATVLVIGSPVYWGNMPGQLKIFFDRNVPLFEYCEARPLRYFPKPNLKGKRAYLFVSGGSPFPFNLLRSQSRGTVHALMTILRAAGIKVASVLNVPDSYRFESKQHRHLRRVRRIARSIDARVYRHRPLE